MKKTTLQKIVIAILVLGNCFFIADYLMRPPHPKHDGPRDEIITMLHFDDQQIQKYDQLIKQHQKDIRHADCELITAKNNLYKNLDQPLNDSLLQRVLEKQSNIEKIHFAHFQDIKSLCKANQFIYFKEFNKKIADLFTHRMKPPRR